MAAKFKSAKEIDAVVKDIAVMLAHWGLRKNDWMLGRYPFLFYHKLFRASECTREATIYVDRNALPWRVKGKARTIVPPKGTKFFREFETAQERHRTGVDFYPVPDNQLSCLFIRVKPLYVRIGKHDVNIESLEKFAWQQRDIEKRYAKSTVAAFRAFYFADKKRYEARDRFNVKVLIRLRKRGDKTLARTWQEVVVGYRAIVRRAYPELFEKQKHVGVLKGTVAWGKGRMVGEVFIVDEHTTPSAIHEKKILVFGHFMPLHIQFLKKAKAIVTEGGGILSHAAVVCRESRIPCIVGVSGVRASIKNGQKITLDFGSGTLFSQ